MSRFLHVLVVLVCLLTAVTFLRASLPKVETGQWTLALDLSQARDGATVTSLASGDSLIAGGNNSAGTLQTTDIYHSDGSLTAAASMSTARSRHTATVLQDGRVLVVGGQSGAGAATNAAEIYDPMLDEWSSAATLSLPRFGHTATILTDGRVAIIGGENSAGPISEIEVYDPGNDSFSHAAALSIGRKDHAVALLADGRVLVAGGFGFDAQNNLVALSSAEIFDPAANSVVAAGSMNVARGRHSATAVLDGFIVVAGGSNGQTDLNSIEIYTPTTDTWVISAATLSTARSGHMASLLPKNNSVLIAGGSSGGAATQSAEMYQKWTDRVVSAGTMNSPHLLGAGSPFSVDGLYLAAGGSGQHSTELFRFATITTDKNDYAPGMPVLMSGTGYQPGESVLLNLKQDDGDADIDVKVEADLAGNISYQGFAPDPGDLGTHFHLTAIGQLSRLQAQTAFTDGNTTVSGTVKSSAAGAPVIPGATVTCNISNGCNAIFTATTDASGNYSLSVQFAGNSHSITLTASANGFASSTSSAFTVSNGNAVTGKDFSLAPVQQATTLALSPGSGTYGGTTNLTATLTVTSGGAPVSGKTISFSLNGTSVGSAATNANGVATLSNATLSGINAGTYATGVTASFAGDTSVTTSSRSAQLTVNKASVSATVTANNKIYNANAAATQNTCTLSGVLAADSTNVTCSAGTLSFADKNVGTAKTVSASGITLSGTAAGNYLLSSTTGTASANITALALTVSAATNSKTYDSNISAAAIPAITLGTLQGADTANFTQSYDTKDAGIAKTLTPSGTVNDGNSGNNYSYTFVNNTTGVINARALTVTAASNTKIYDGTISAAATPTITLGLLQGTDTANFIETYDTRHAGTGKTLTPSGSVNDGNSGNNYSYAFVNNSTGVISQRPLTVTAAINSKVYDGTTSAAAIPNVTAGTLASGETGSFTESYDSKNVGTTKTLTPSGTVKDSSNADVTADYSITFSTISSGIITARPIAVMAATDTKIYDGTTDSSVVPGITSGSLAVGDTSSFTQLFDSRNAGARSLTASGSVNDGNSGNNYAVSFEPASGAIEKRAITASAVGDTKIYDATTSSSATPTVGAPGIAAGDTASFIQSFDNKNAGTGKTLTATGSVSDGNSGNNYFVTFAGNSTGVIKARPLTVTAAENTKTYDGNVSAAAVPSITSGVLQGPDSASFSETYDTKNAGSGKALTPAGTITDGNGGNNYSVTFNSVNTGVVNKRALTVSATADNKIYDGTTSAAAQLADDRIVGDVLTDAYASAVFSDKNAGTGKPVSISGISISGPDSGNYILSSATASAIANITPRSLAVSANGVNKIYDGTTAATVTLSDDRLSGDLLTDSYTIASFADKNAGNGKPVSVSGISISGPDAANYTFNTVASASANITPLAITGSITAANKIYDGTTAAIISGRTLSGVLGADSVSYTGGMANFSDRNVGIGKLVTAAGLLLSGTDAGNYTVNSNATASANISPLPIAVTASPQSKVFGTVDPTLAYTVDPPLAPGDSFIGNLTRVAGENAGNYAIQQGSLGAGLNYTMTFTGGQLTITRANTATVIVSSAGSVQLGQGVTFTATVADASLNSVGNPAGSVQFYVDGALFGAPAAVNNAGVASISTSSLSASAGHAVSAIYLGDSNFLGSTSGTINISILYAAGGSCLGSAGHQILQPINADGSSTFKQGSTVPAKFRVCDINGNSIGTSGVVRAFNLVGIYNGTIVSSVDEAVDSTTPDTSFRWDSSSQQWIFNISTKSLNVHSTYNYQVKLNDGSIIAFQYGLPK
jgi:hypothetical protein